MKRLFYVFLSVIIFTSCELGLGEALDLKGPELYVQEPLPLSLVKKEFTIHGTCYDNQKVKSIEIKDKSTNKVYAYASINNNEWHAKLSLKEGEVSLVITAYDAANNPSDKSQRIITLLVDETAPEGLSWYVDRGNGFQVQLRDKETLENLNLEDLQNIDVPQNEKFTIYGNFYDAMSIKEISFILSEDDQEICRKTVTASDAEVQSATEDFSIYAPNFTFTHDELVGYKSSLASGKHYLKLSYASSDEHGNQSVNEVGYFLWYPESDQPVIHVIKADENGKLTENVGSAIAIDIFDDDLLEEAYYTVEPENTSITIGNIEANKEKFIYKNSGFVNIRNYPAQIEGKYTESAGRYKLIAYAKEQKDSGAKIKTKIIDMNIVDSAVPLIIVEAPTENTVPEIYNNTKFKISGYCYDSSGSKDIKIAYIPSEKFPTAVLKEARAKEIFQSGNTSNGEILKTFTFPSEKVKDGSWVKEEFSFEFDVVNDFSLEKNKSKFFEMMVTDNEGNVIYKQFSVSGDSLKPEIIINEPSDDMIVYDYNNQDLVISFTASKSSGLGIDQNSYKVIRKESSDEYSIENGKLKKNGDSVQITIPQKTLKEWANETQVSFTFFAKDLLDNEASAQRTIVLSELPNLESVTTEKSNGKYSIGQIIPIQVKFTDTVKVNGSPILKLKLSEDKEVDALYKNGTGTDTLTFEYVVQEGDSSEQLQSSRIDLNGGKIVTGTIGSGDAGINIPVDKHLQNNKNGIVVDGNKPKIEKIFYEVITENVSLNNGEYFLNSDKEVNVTVQFSEKVFVSGSPILNLFVKGISNIGLNFQSIKDNSVVFSYKIGNTTPEGIVQFIESKLFTSSDKKLIKDEAGNEINIENVTTQNLKYALINSIENECKLNIDITVPVNAPSINLTSGDYNQPKELELSKGESGALMKYSLDDGKSWNEYSSPVLLTSGNYSICTMQIDKASNESKKSDTVNVKIKDTFPLVNLINIRVPDGKYKVGQKIKITAYLDEEVMTVPENSATLTIKSCNGAENEKTINVIPSNTKTKQLNFEYIIQKGDNYDGVQITALNLLETIVDKYGNVPTENTKNAIEDVLLKPECTRSELIIDAKPPTITRFTPTKGSPCKDNSFKIVLEFDENIYKESGTIVLQRKGDWYIPPVFEEEEFMEIYNAISSEADKEKLLKTTIVNGQKVNLTHGRTGKAVGPYIPIPHGLIQSDSKAIPDTRTKYVLDFNLGIKDGQAQLNDGTETGTFTAKVSDIRDVLESIEYHKHKEDIRSEKISISGSNGYEKNVLTIEFTDEIQNGIEWELIIPDTCFRDQAGNMFEGFTLESEDSTKSYSCWSDKVATPVVRLDKYSHGWGADLVNSDGTITTITKNKVNAGGENNGSKYTDADTSGTGVKIAPTGYARVRIDCQTPGATIKYKKYETSSVDVNTMKQSYRTKYPGVNMNTDSNNRNNNKNEVVSTNADIEYATLGERPSDADDYKDTYVVIGDGKINTARKDYVSAYATKAGFEDSDAGFEGIFKTVIYAWDCHEQPLVIEGGTETGGEPTVASFPVRDGTQDRRYCKNSYYNSEDNGHEVWISYDIVCGWKALYMCREHSDGYINSSYGEMTYTFNYETYWW